MVIVTCVECGIKYELGNGENPEDFQCECGGELIYSESLEDIKEYSKPETTIKCPHCGSTNPDYAKFCQECGKKQNSEISKENELKKDKPLNSSKVGINLGNSLGNKLIQAKTDLQTDLNLLKEFENDLEKIVEKYSSDEVESEEEFQEQIRKIDSEIKHKKESLDKKLKYYSNRIIVDKIRDKDKPFSLKYSISIKQGKKPYKEREVFLKDSENKKTKLKVEIWKSSIKVPDIKFNSISFIKSEDENFILAYRDQMYDSRDGTRKLIKGRTIFINQNELFLINDLERPHDGKLAKNGTFILNDWMTAGEREGTFYVFNSEAKVLIKKKFNSNLGKNGISESGQYGIVETLYSDSNDGNKIFFFDLCSGKLIWESVRSVGNIKSFKFNENKKILTISYGDFLNYHHTFQGDFLDEEKLQKERIGQASGYELFSIAKEKMDDLDYKTSNLSDYEEVLYLLEKASNKDVSRHTKAGIHRMIGEIYYNYGKTDLTLFNFEKALNWNPNVGIKRLYEKLKNENRQ